MCQQLDAYESRTLSAVDISRRRRHRNSALEQAGVKEMLNPRRRNSTLCSTGELMGTPLEGCDWVSATCFEKT